MIFTWWCWGVRNSTILGICIKKKGQPKRTCFHFLSLDLSCLRFMLTCLTQFIKLELGYLTLIANVNKTNSGLGLPYNKDPSPSFISSLGPCKWISLATMALNISLLVGQLDFCICIQHVVGQTNKIWAVPFYNPCKRGRICILNNQNKH